MRNYWKFKLKFIFSSTVVIVNLLLIIYFTFQTVSLPSIGMIVSSSATVGFVFPSSPLYSSVRIGDQIIAINSYSILDEPESAQQELVLNRYIGKPLDFQFERVTSDGDSFLFDLIVRLDEPSRLATFFRLSPFVVAFAFWAVGLLFILYRPTEDVQQILFFFCQSWATLLIIAASPIIEIKWLEVSGFIITLFAIFFTILLHLNFPVPFKTKTKFVFLTIVGAIIVAEGVLEVFALFTNDGELASTLDLIRPVLLVVSLLIALFLLIYAYTLSEKPDEKRQIGFVAIGGGIAILPLFVFSLLPDFLQGYPILPYESVIYFFVAIPLGYGIAIWKFDFIKIEKYANRTAVLILTTTFVLGLYYLVSYAFLRELTPSNDTEPLQSSLIVILPVLLFIPIYNRLQKKMDQLFYGGWYSYSSVVAQVSATLEKLDEHSDLPQILTKTVKELMRLKFVGLYIPNDGINMSLSSVAADLSLDITSILPQNGELVSYLSKGTLAQRPSEILNKIESSQLTKLEMELLNDPSIGLFVPIQEMNNSIGLFVLGDKITGDPYEANDSKILDMISRLTSITFKNFQLIQDLEEKASQNEQYKREILRVRDEERSYLSRELHDRVIQELVGLNYQIKKLDREIPIKNHETVATISNLQGVVGALIQTTRYVCQDLRPPALDLGIIPSVRSVVNKFEAKSNAEVQLVIDGDRNLEIDETIAICLYRCVSEALENIFKHAHATTITVEITIQDDRVFFKVADNGQGFILPQHLGDLMKFNHYGLVGMRERVELLNGDFAIVTGPNVGTQVSATIPTQFQYTQPSVPNQAGIRA